MQTAKDTYYAMRLEKLCSLAGKISVAVLATMTNQHLALLEEYKGVIN